ncbi:MAG: hypothetical protein M9915_03320 [Rhizobacter sp.]|nr:hypothetical protein [Rhizobacter sp.]
MKNQQRRGHLSPPNTPESLGEVQIRRDHHAGVPSYAAEQAGTVTHLILGLLLNGQVFNHRG